MDQQETRETLQRITLGLRRLSDSSLASSLAEGNVRGVLTDVLTQYGYDHTVQIDEQPGPATAVASPAACPWPESTRGGEYGHCAECQAHAGLFTVNLLRQGRRQHFDGSACLANREAVCRQEHLAGLVAASGLTAREQTHTFDAAGIDRHNRALFDELRAWQPGETGYYIHAAPDTVNIQGNGTGKSYLLHAITLRLCGEGIRCRYCRTTDFLREIKAAFRSETDSEEAVVERYSTVPVLCWDDLGHESFRADSDWAPERFYQVLDARTRAGLPLVIASNYKILPVIEERFGSNFGPAIASRIAGACQVRTLGGPDRRWMTAMKTETLTTR